MRRCLLQHPLWRRQLPILYSTYPPSVIQIQPIYRLLLLVLQRSEARHLPVLMDSELLNPLQHLEPWIVGSVAVGLVAVASEALMDLVLHLLISVLRRTATFARRLRRDLRLPPCHLPVCLVALAIPLPLELLPADLEPLHRRPLLPPAVALAITALEVPLMALELPALLVPRKIPVFGLLRHLGHHLQLFLLLLVRLMPQAVGSVAVASEALMDLVLHPLISVLRRTATFARRLRRDLRLPPCHLPVCLAALAIPLPLELLPMDLEPLHRRPLLPPAVALGATPLVLPNRHLLLLLLLELLMGWAAGMALAIPLPLELLPVDLEPLHHRPLFPPAVALGATPLVLPNRHLLLLLLLELLMGLAADRKSVV